MTGHPETKSDLEALLHRLNSADAGPAWSAFVDRFAPLIMKVVSQFEYGEDRSDECFLFVCEGLVENGFHRLLKFKTGGKASFSTWLGAVTFNLCIDWHRKEFGRVQMIPAISALPSFDQAVYRLCFEDGFSNEASFKTLQADFPDLSRQQLSDSMARVHRVLTPRQRWQVNIANRRKRNKLHVSADEIDDLKHGGPSPEQEALIAEKTLQLQAAMAKLDPEQRLLLHLRFQQGLTLQQIAETMRLGDPFRARRRIQTVLDSLEVLINRASRRNYP